MKLGILILPLALLPLTEPVPGEPVSAVATTALQLNQIELGDEKWEVPSAARPLLTIFKQQLRDLIGRELNASAGSESAGAIQVRLTNALAREGVPVVAESSDDPYGRVIGLEVQRPAGLDRWLAVEVTQQIACGTDAALYLFERRDTGWRLAFALESNGYEDVAGALGSFRFGISPPDTHGGFFLVAGDINPWCSSNWQRIRYRAFRIGGDPLHPQPFFEEEEGIYIENGFELSVKADRFLVSFEGSQNLDAGILIRSYVRAYRVTGTKVERTGPLAAEERGFIDEWISLPWEIAGRWTAIPRWDSLRAWHYKLQGFLKRKGEDLYTEFRWWGNCGPSRSLAVLDLEWDQPSESLPDELFFTVQRHGDDFEMERIGVTEPEGCAVLASP